LRRDFKNDQERAVLVFIDFQHDGRVEVNHGLDLEVRLENLLKFTYAVKAKTQFYATTASSAILFVRYKKIQIKTRWHETKQLKDAAICIDNVSDRG